MRRVVLFLSLLGILTSAVAAPVAADTRRTPAECAAALDCTAEEIDRMTMAERLEFVRDMQSGPGAQLGVTDRWRNIEGVITFFRDRQLGPPGTWVSYVDSGIVEGIERGIAMALGWSTDGFGNPGSAKWASYITGVTRTADQPRRPRPRLERGRAGVHRVRRGARGGARAFATDGRSGSTSSPRCIAGRCATGRSRWTCWRCSAR